MIDIPQWGEVRESELEAALGIKKITLLNDFVANGYGIQNLPEEDKICLYEPQILNKEENIKLIFGAGTGLGICVMARADSSSEIYHPFSSEGGCAMF